LGESQIEVPRDRDGSFEPAIVPKRKGLAKGIEDLVISLYAKGMGNSDIEEQLREIYDFRLSTSTISNITAKIHQDILEWQSRPLDPVYLIVWMDGIVFKVRQSGKVINKTIYLAVGLNRDGKKEVLGMWLGETESASFWSGVLSDLQSRGLEDILITSTDNLKGFTDAIRSIFTGAVTQICVVHQTRNASRYVVWKDKKAFHSDMKAIYNAPNKDAARMGTGAV
jgi:putative transposase